MAQAPAAHVSWQKYWSQSPDATVTQEAWTTSILQLTHTATSTNDDYYQTAEMSVKKATVNDVTSLWWGYSLQLNFKNDPAIKNAVTQFVTLDGVATGDSAKLLDFHCFNTIGSGMQPFFGCGPKDISTSISSTKMNVFYQQNEQNGNSCANSPAESQGFKLVGLSEPVARSASNWSYLSCYNWRNDLASRNKVRQFSNGFEIKFNYGFAVGATTTSTPSSYKVSQGIKFVVSDAALALVASGVAVSSMSSYLF